MSFFKELKEDIAQSVSELTETLEDDLEGKSVSDTPGRAEIKDIVLEEPKEEAAGSAEVDAEALADLTAMYDAELQGGAEEKAKPDKGMEDLIASEIEKFRRETEEAEQQALETEVPEDEIQEIEAAIDVQPESGETITDTMDLKEDSIMSEELVKEAEADVVDEVMDGETMEEEITVITQGTTISGSIKSDTSLLVKGTIEGDVECQGKLTIVGRVAGNTIAKEIYVNTPRLEGDINSRGIVKVDVGTVVIGNVSCTSLVIAGAVKGDVDVNGPVVIDSTAVVQGNVRAKSIQLNSGAIIAGNYSLAYADVDLDALFEK